MCPRDTEVKSILILSDREGGIEEDQELLSSFSKQGYHARIHDWKSKEIVKISAASNVAIIRTAWDYTDHLTEFLDTLYKISRQTLLVNSLKIVEWNFNKKYLLYLSDKDIPIIESIYIDKYERNSLIYILKQKPWKRFIIKPAVGAGGRRINLLSREALHTMDINDSFSNGYGVIAQPFESDILVHGEWALLYFCDELVFSVHKTPAAGEYKVQRQYGGTESVGLPPDDVVRLAEKCLDAMPEQPHFARIDILAIPGSPKLVELEAIEPRLFFDVYPGFADIFVQKLCARLS